MICYYAPFHTIRGLLITSHVDILRAAVHKLYVYIRNREIDHISITTNRSPLPTTIQPSRSWIRDSGKRVYSTGDIIAMENVTL